MDRMGGKDDQGNNQSLKGEEMCWRNGIWHLRIKIASPANTFAIITSVQSSTACTPSPPGGARWQHLHEDWTGNGKLELSWLSLLYYWWGGMMAAVSADIWHVTECFVPVPGPSLATALQTVFYEYWGGMEPDFATLFLVKCETFWGTVLNCVSSYVSFLEFCKNSKWLAYAKEKFPILACICLPWSIRSAPLCDFCHFKHPLHCFVSEHLLYNRLLMNDLPERNQD